MSVFPHTKAGWRERAMRIRHEIPPAEKTAASALICQRLENWPQYRNAKNILCYAPLPDEPDLLPLCRRYWGEKNFLFPRIFGKALEVKAVESPDRFVPGVFGIAEPPPDAPDFPKAQLDLVLVPALAVDLHGNRLGFGGGYFDRFLQNVNAIKLAVIFQAQLLDELPAESHDVRMDGWVTEEEVARVGK